MTMNRSAAPRSPGFDHVGNQEESRLVRELDLRDLSVSRIARDSSMLRSVEFRIVIPYHAAAKCVKLQNEPTHKSTHNRLRVEWYGFEVRRFSGSTFWFRTTSQAERPCNSRFRRFAHEW